MGTYLGTWVIMTAEHLPVSAEYFAYVSSNNFPTILWVIVVSVPCLLQWGKLRLREERWMDGPCNIFSHNVMFQPLIPPLPRFNHSVP